MAMTKEQVAENIKQVSVLYSEISDLQDIGFSAKETPEGKYLVMSGNKMLKGIECGVKLPATLTTDEVTLLVTTMNENVDTAVKSLVKNRKHAIKTILAALTTEMSNV